MKNPIKAHSRIRGSAIRAICILALAALGSAGSAWAETRTVTTLNDSGAGSLRQAIAVAGSGDTITFGVYGTITLTSVPLVIAKNLNIEGPGPQDLRISGNHTGRVFVILAGEVTLAGLTISDGLADGNSPIIPGVPVDTRSAGGAILNLSGLILSDVVLSDSEAVGDPLTAPLGFPGAGFGGAVANLGSMTVNDSEFIGNLARGADGINTLGSIPPGPPAGFAGGGGIANAGTLRVIHSRFTRNQAVGGNYNYSLFFPGHAPGGAILSSAPGATLDVSDSEFSHNQAVGGDGNFSPPAVPADFGANKSTGGAINVAGGMGTLDRCTFMHNQSVGGAGAPGADGGIGAGGAITVTDASGYSSEAIVRNSKIKHNLALGGPGSDGGNGGNGQGGGLISAAAGILTVIDTTVSHNDAQGGPGGEEGNGGNGLGGGFYDDYNHPDPPPPYGDSVLELQGAVVTKNLASGGEGGNGGLEGDGVGGGVYWLGTYSADNKTVIKKNEATTSNDNVGP